MHKVIAVLLDIQANDAKQGAIVAQVRILEAQQRQLVAKLKEEEERIEERRQRLRDLEHASLMRNLQVDELDDQIREYQRRLDGDIISYKEMEMLREKILLERNRIDELEDGALEMMEEIEAAKTTLAKAERDLETRRAGHASQMTELDELIAEQQQLLVDRRQAREELAGNVSAYVLEKYDALRINFPDPVVEIVEGTCGGCKLRISSSTVERVRGERDLVTCENCNRILFIV
ncbi:hypothetical protein JW848_06590 [Candidatus Bipolaricaulota bacterium]|nr:hypothetical protein [Candidatus Bipolaricaulota bacterium]